MKNKNIFVFIALALIVILGIQFISAERYENNYFKYGTVDSSGNIVPTSTAVNNVQIFGVVCSSSNCGTISGRLWNSQTLTSTNNFIQLTYPTTLQSTYGYGVYMVKEGYIPYEVTANWWGTSASDPVGPYDNYLTRKQNCHPEVNTLSSSFSNGKIYVTTNIDSPISHAGPLNYVPTELISHYSANADVHLEVRKNSILYYSENKTVNIVFSGNTDVSFNFDASASGDYEIQVYTTVNNDAKCIGFTTFTKTTTTNIPGSCSQNSDCGTNGFVDSLFCQTDDVFQNYITYTCNNAGQYNSYCSSSTSAQFKTDCGDDSCSSYESNYCSNNNVYHSRTCYDRGCSLGSCFNTQSTEATLVQTCRQDQVCSNGACMDIICTQNLDCGIDQCAGAPNYCMNNDLYQDFLFFTCNNPGLFTSFCSNITSPHLIQDCGDSYCQSYGQNYCKNNNLYHSRLCFDRGCSSGACNNNQRTDETLVQTCSYGCNNNQCVVPECVSNSDCPSGKVCQNNYCVSVTCNANSDCGQNGFIGELVCSSNNVFQNYRTYTCNNPGTPSSSCSNTIALQLKQTCLSSQICSSGICMTPVCSSNSQCGTDGFIDTVFCQNNNIFQNYRTYTCNNPGTISSSCTNTITSQLKQTCSTNQLCSSGTCNSFVCSTDSQCNDNNVNTEDRCSNPGTLQSQCIHTNIACFSDSNCGTNGLIDGLFCQNNNVFQNYRTYTCNNPGTISSSCTNALTAQLKQTCSTNQLCSNGACSNIVCSSNSQCGTSGFENNKFCENKNVYDNYITYTCNNANTTSSSCSHTTNKTLIESCSYDCQNGVCLQPTCTQNSNCGSVSSKLLCKNNNVVRETITPTCTNNSCENVKTTAVVEECDYRCSNAECKEESHGFYIEDDSETITPLLEQGNYYTDEGFNYTIIQESVTQAKVKEATCTSISCNSFWLWFFIIFLLILLIILLVLFIVWVFSR